MKQEENKNGKTFTKNVHNHFQPFATTEKEENKTTKKNLANRMIFYEEKQRLNLH